ncbi:MAG: DUF7482 domain-containing protein, partial [Nitrososphaeraceae archaeon]
MISINLSIELKMDLGFKSPVSSVNLQDPNYSSMCRVLFVSWKDPQNVYLLQTMTEQCNKRRINRD